MHTYNNPTTKTVHHVVHITSTEVELFAIRCSINQASNCDSISKIIIITNSIYAAKKIFDPSLYPFQVHSVAILTELWKFFLQHQDNSIEFWECPSHLNWSSHKMVDKESKAFNSSLLFPCKTSWDFSKKRECDDIPSVKPQEKTIPWLVWWWQQYHWTILHQRRVLAQSLWPFKFSVCMCFKSNNQSCSN